MIPLRWVRLSPRAGERELERELGVYVHAADLLALLEELGPELVARELGELMESPPPGPSWLSIEC